MYELTFHVETKYNFRTTPVVFMNQSVFTVNRVWYSVCESVHLLSILCTDAINNIHEKRVPIIKRNTARAHA